MAQFGGRFSTATSSDFSNDAEAAVEYLKTRHEVDSLQIELIGHSEGGIIAPMVAARNKRVAFVVMLARVSVPGHEVLKTQVEDMAKASGVPDSARKINNRITERMYELILTCSDQKYVLDSLTVYIRQSEQVVQPEFSIDVDDPLLKATARWMLSPWMQYFLRYDPAPTLRKVTCPVLALNGTKDMQVAAQSNLSAIRKALEEGGNTSPMRQVFSTSPCRNLTPARSSTLFCPSIPINQFAFSASAWDVRNCPLPHPSSTNNSPEQHNTSFHFPLFSRESLSTPSGK